MNDSSHTQQDALRIGRQDAGGAVLFSEMRPEAAWEDEFNTWYDTEHIPVRMAAPGFIGARRYRATESDDYLVVYEMASMAALATPEYDRIKNQPSELTRRMLGGVHGFTRYLGETLAAAGGAQADALDAPLLFAAMFDVPPAELADFDAWYEQDHVPLLLECSDWLMVRRFHLTAGEPRPFNRLALHYLASEQALSSPARARARETPWRERMAGRDWFGKGRYAVFRRVGRTQSATR